MTAARGLGLLRLRRCGTGVLVWRCSVVLSPVVVVVMVVVMVVSVRPGALFDVRLAAYGLLRVQSVAVAGLVVVVDMVTVPTASDSERGVTQWSPGGDVPLRGPVGLLLLGGGAAVMERGGTVAAAAAVVVLMLGQTSPVLRPLVEVCRSPRRRCLEQ